MTRTDVTGFPVFVPDHKTFRRKPESIAFKYMIREYPLNSRSRRKEVHTVIRFTSVAVVVFDETFVVSYEAGNPKMYVLTHLETGMLVPHSEAYLTQHALTNGLHTLYRVGKDSLLRAIKKGRKHASRAS